jgi:hypothetical protein
VNQWIRDTPGIAGERMLVLEIDRAIGAPLDRDLQRTQLYIA